MRVSKARVDFQHHLNAARERYCAGRHAEALELNEALRDAAEEASIPELELLGHRYVGLCEYRLDRLDESEKSLRRALELATELGWTRQELLITNHLCATLRRRGEYLEAHGRFTHGLSRAKLPTYIHERCRLLGNFGAFLDELGQRAAADDCYARFEELAELLENDGRLANARGLAARAAELRGDRSAAQQKYLDELRLARQSGGALRALAAEIHAARLLEPRESIQELTRILNAGDITSSTSREIDAHLAIARAYMLLAVRDKEGGAVSLAWSHAKRVLGLAGERALVTDSHWEKRAVANELLARITQHVGLHGEALHYLKEAVGERYQKYEPLRRSEDVQRMGEERLRSLEGLAEELLDEAMMVMRSEPEQAELAGLLERVRGRRGGSGAEGLLAERNARRGGEENLWAWGKMRRERAREQWRLLMGDDFSSLDPHSQEDLIQSDMSYSAGINDLARSAHLLATVVERELKTKLLLGWSGRASFGELLRSMRDVQSPRARGRSRRTPGRDPYAQLCSHLRPRASEVSSLARLGGPIHNLNGEEIDLRKVRNSVAHGSERVDYPDFERLTLDAIKRVLAVEPSAPGRISLLRYIARLP